MKINLFSIFLLLLYLVASSFFGLLTLLIPNQDAVLLLSLSVILFYMKGVNVKSVYEDRNFHYFFIYAFVTSLIMAYLNFSQPALYSIKAARIFLIYSVLLIALNILLKQVDPKRYYPGIVIFSFIIIGINFYVYITGDTSILSEDVPILKRLGEIRVVIGTFSIIIFILFFYHHLSENRWFILPLLGLLFTVVVVHKTRSLLFPLLIIMFIPLLRVYKAQFFKFWLIFIVLVLLSFMATGYEKSIISPITDLLMLLIEESQTTGHSNVNIRAMELAYFWSFLDTKSILFGYGMENIQFKVLYESHFYLSDIGLFKVFYLHGVVGILLYIFMYWRLYLVSKKSNTPLHLTGRSIVYFQILSPSTILLYTPEFMLLFMGIYVLIKNRNKIITLSIKESRSNSV